MERTTKQIHQLLLGCYTNLGGHYEDAGTDPKIGVCNVCGWWYDDNKDAHYTVYPGFPDRASVEPAEVKHFADLSPLEWKRHVVWAQLRGLL